jgi:hypothetical protein
MSVVSSLQNLSRLIRIEAPAVAAPPTRAASTIDPTAAVDFGRVRERLLSLFDSLQQLGELAGVQSRFRLDLPDARSASSLGLDLSSTAARLASTEEINTAPHSFMPFGPEWAGASSAPITITGAYDGSNGTDTLTIESRRNGTRGSDDLRIWVNDSLGNRLQNFTIGRSDPIGQQYDLQNGLFLSLGAGALVSGATAALQVYNGIGAAVIPGNPLGGVRNASANLEYGGPAIANGAFAVNGEAISVSTGDSINDVIARVNASDAGVTATFDAVSETIGIVQNTTGSVPTIDLQGDTSGFLAATKLASATLMPGSDPENEKALRDVAAFAQVQAGNIVINGQQIAIDPTSDSLDAVLGKINASSAEVTATFDEGTQQVLIEANNAESALNIASNGTNLFSALRMPEGRVDAEAQSGGISRSRSYRIADAAEQAFAELSELFRDDVFEGGGTYVRNARNQLETALRKTFGGEESAEVFGFRFDARASALTLGEFATIDRRELTRNLQLRGRRVQGMLSTADGSGGLLPDLLRATGRALTAVNQTLGLGGTLIDDFA